MRPQLEKCVVRTVEEKEGVLICIKCRKKMHVDDVVYVIANIYRCPRCGQEAIDKEEQDARRRTHF